MQIGRSAMPARVCIDRPKVKIYLKLNFKIELLSSLCQDLRS